MKTRALVLTTAFALLAFARESQAQLKGHYIPGFTGLQSASQAPPSISVILPVFLYTTDNVKDNDGNTVAQPRVNVSFVGPGVAAARRCPSPS